jgi:predicted phage terminase large subunit-like protein
MAMGLTEDFLKAAATISQESCLADYIPAAWPVIEPHRDFLPNWHISLVAEYLEAVSANEINRLIINIPPRYMKSLTVSVFWPTWTWTRRPETRWTFASYAAALAMKHSLDRRAILESEWYQDRWGAHVRLAPDQNAKTEYLNTARGVMVATSIGGSITGKGGDFVVVDDPINPMQAESDLQRQAAITYFDRTLSTRLDDKKKGAIVVVMHRLHENDLTGHLLQDIGWEHLDIPVEAKDRRTYVYPRSGRAVMREPGTLLWPEREDWPEIAEAKRRLGSYGFAGQYEQRPSAAEGGLFKRAWWKFYQQAPAAFDTVLQSWDMSFKALNESDYVCGQVWGRVGADCYLLDQVHEQLTFTQTVSAVKGLSAKWPATLTKLVEDKANGTAVIDVLQHDIPGLIPVEPEGGKLSRASAISPLIEAGNVYVPDPLNHPWVSDFIEECANFPRGAHDDQVDAMSQALLRLQTITAAADLSVADIEQIQREYVRAQAEAGTLEPARRGLDLSTRSLWGSRRRGRYW